MEGKAISAVTVRVLGSGDPVASGGRLQSGTLVDDGQGLFLLDCGATVVAALAGSGVDPAAVELVLVSHLHGDHIAGLPFLLLARWFAARRGEAAGELTVAGPTGTEPRLAAMLELFGYTPLAELRAAAPVRFVALEAGRETALGPRAVTAFDVVHFPDTEPTALRVATAGRVIAYSGDTGWTDALVEAADGADLFLCMCHTYDRAAPTHMSYRALMAQRARLRCRRLLLTHLGHDLLAHVDAVRTELAGDPAVQLAEDGTTVAL